MTTRQMVGTRNIRPPNATPTGLATTLPHADIAWTGAEPRDHNQAAVNGTEIKASGTSRLPREPRTQAATPIPTTFSIGALLLLSP